MRPIMGCCSGRWLRRACTTKCCGCSRSAATVYRPRRWRAISHSRTSPSKQVTAAWLAVYHNAEKDWDLYELAERLVDLDHRFQLWRFQHMKTVERIIGYKPGTGGTAGVSLPGQGAAAQAVSRTLGSAHVNVPSAVPAMPARPARALQPCRSVDQVAVLRQPQVRQVGAAVAVGIDALRRARARSAPADSAASPRRGNWPSPAGHPAARRRASAPRCRCISLEAQGARDARHIQIDAGGHQQQAIAAAGDARRSPAALRQRVPVAHSPPHEIARPSAASVGAATPPRVACSSAPLKRPRSRSTRKRSAAGSAQQQSRQPPGLAPQDSPAGKAAACHGA